MLMCPLARAHSQICLTWGSLESSKESQDGMAVPLHSWVIMALLLYSPSEELVLYPPGTTIALASDQTCLCQVFLLSEWSFAACCWKHRAQQVNLWVTTASDLSFFSEDLVMAHRPLDSDTENSKHNLQLLCPTCPWNSSRLMSVWPQTFTSLSKQIQMSTCCGVELVQKLLTLVFCFLKTFVAPLRVFCSQTQTLKYIRIS